MALSNQSIATSEIRNFLLNDLISILILFILLFILLGMFIYKDFKRKTFLKKHTKKRTKKRSKKLTRKLIKKLMLKYGAAILPIFSMIAICVYYMRDLVDPQVIVVEGYVNVSSFAGGGRRNIYLQHSEGSVSLTQTRPRRPIVIRRGNFYRIYYTPHTRTIIHAVLLEEYEVFIDEN